MVARNVILETLDQISLLTNLQNFIKTDAAAQTLVISSPCERRTMDSIEKITKFWKAESPAGILSH